MKILTTTLLFLLPSVSMAAGDFFSGEVALSWHDNSINEDGFYIERSIDKAPFERIGQTGANETTYVDHLAKAGALNTYRVQAFNQFGVTGYTNKSGVGIFLPDGDPSGLETTFSIDITGTLTLSGASTQTTQQPIANP